MVWAIVMDMGRMAEALATQRPRELALSQYSYQQKCAFAYFERELF